VFGIWVCVVVMLSYVLWVGCWMGIPELVDVTSDLYPPLPSRHISLHDTPKYPDRRTNFLSDDGKTLDCIHTTTFSSFVPKKSLTV